MESTTQPAASSPLTFEDFKAEVLRDYRLAVLSRACSLLGRKEVLTGKAKFGIFGDGKEVPQLAMAKAFQNGDFRSGYYRDQTFMMAIGQLTPVQFFAGLYGHPDLAHDPMSGGRQMGGHFATHLLDDSGNWVNALSQKNTSADISPTAGQMPRLLGLAQASKVYRALQDQLDGKGFSQQGNEVAWGTIGNASTSEGLFFETINAAGVLQVPMVMSVWDDEYGISVHARHQTTKESISEILKGFQREGKGSGYEIFTVMGWDYPALVDTYQKASAVARTQHVPVLIHVQQLTQPQGHSTSGSHERYKSTERLAWEKEYDCNAQMRAWLIAQGLATDAELEAMEADAQKEVNEAKKAAWKAYQQPILDEREQLLALLAPMATDDVQAQQAIQEVKQIKEPIRKDLLVLARQLWRRWFRRPEADALRVWIQQYTDEQGVRYSSKLFTHTALSPQFISGQSPIYDENAEWVDGRVILRDNFKVLFDKHPELLIFGEDSGKIGDVNQGLENMQEWFGETRVSDAGIREATILGQGIGMAMRGLRPIAEIQYLDYLLYALQIMSDDLATLSYRTVGRQKAPLIIRTRGHRLEGIWHSGSPMGMIIHALRGIHVLVPRDMTRAAGFYNTLLAGDEPALVVECLNGYRLKEKMPANLGSFKIPLGEVEVLRPGTDITLVSYGSTLRLVMQAADELAALHGIQAEVIDVQSLLPFDKAHHIVESLQKTNRLLVIDEDVPGGASAYIMQQIVEVQNGYRWLDSKPQTLTARAHRPAYGTDGDYFSKPSLDDIYDKVFDMMLEAQPERFR